MGEMVQKLQIFLRESYQELRKVTWPGRKEVLGSTLVVVGTVAACMLATFLSDVIIQKTVGFFLK